MAKSVSGRAGKLALTSMIFMSALAAFELSRFHDFHERVKKLLSGDYQGVVKIQLIDAKVRGLKELAANSSESSGVEEAFAQRSGELRKDVLEFGEFEGSGDEKRVSEIGRLAEQIAGLKLENPDASILSSFQKVQEQCFQLYRLSWVNKWMTVAKVAGQLVTDLNETPPNAGIKVQKMVFPRVTQLVGMVTGSYIAQDHKIIIFEQLNILKNLVNAYEQSVEKSTKLKSDRLDKIDKMEAMVEKVSADQAHGLVSFGSGYQPELVHAISGAALILLLALAWLWGSAARIGSLLKNDMKTLRASLEKWKNSGKLEIAKSGYSEVDAIARDIKNVAVVMQERHAAEARLREHAATPQAVVSANKSALLWNEALSDLAQQQKFSDVGPISYSRLLKFMDGKEKPIDPIGKCMVDGKEFSQICFLQAGSEHIPVLLQCVPVYESADSIGHVVVELRDLRNEQRRIEAELEKQISFIDAALEALKSSKIPEEPPEASKQSVVGCVQKIRSRALAWQESRDVLYGQIEVLWGRVERETQMGQRSLGQVDEVRERITSLAAAIKEVCEHAKNMSWLQKNTVSSSADVQRKLQSLRKQFDALAFEMEHSKRTLTTAAGSLERSQTVFTKVHVLQQVIEKVLKKSSVLNANNAILGSQTISANDLVSISENISEILQQFDRGYQNLASVVNVLEKGFRQSSEKILHDISLCVRILGDDEQLISEVKALEQVYKKGHEELTTVFEAVKSLENAALRTGATLDAVAEKTDQLAQLENSAFELHGQVAQDLRHIFDKVGSEKNS